jgi:hypothetical protein
VTFAGNPPLSFGPFSEEESAEKELPYRPGKGKGFPGLCGQVIKEIELIFHGFFRLRYPGAGAGGGGDQSARIVIQRRGSSDSKEFVDPGKELLRAEGFGQEVVGSHAEGGFPVSILAFCGEDDNRQPFTMGLASDKFQDLKSRILGHHDVQEC